jgi:ABC-type glycerol-3-phosphate transport system substrate-binding protein
MRKLLFAVTVCALVAAGCSRAPEPPPFKAVAETKVLMDAVMEKQADIVWGAVGTIIDEHGETPFQPKTDEEWAAVKDAAVNLTETGNLLLIVPRMQDGDRWVKNVQAMMAQGEKMIAAIDRKNPKEINDVGSDLYDTCTNCHKHYIPSIKDIYANEP